MLSSWESLPECAFSERFRIRSLSVSAIVRRNRSRAASADRSPISGRMARFQISASLEAPITLIDDYYLSNSVKSSTLTKQPKESNGSNANITNGCAFGFGHSDFDPGPHGQIAFSYGSRLTSL